MAEEVRKALTTEEKLAKVKADRDRMLARLQEREKSIVDQGRFGGAGAISQQKIVLGAWLWKLSQSDKAVADAVRLIHSKMDAESKAKIQKLIEVLDGKK